MRKGRAPSAEPWGIPAGIGSQDDVLSLGLLPVGSDQ